MGIETLSISSFIDKSLNSYIAKIIVKKQIPDVLLTLTNIDRTYESSIKEVKVNTIKNNKTYDLLGREVFEIPKGSIYIKNRKKYIK